MPFSDKNDLGIANKANSTILISLKCFSLNIHWSLFTIWNVHIELYKMNIFVLDNEQLYLHAMHSFGEQCAIILT